MHSLALSFLVFKGFLTSKRQVTTITSKMAFNQFTTPTALDQLIRQAKLESPVKTISRSFENDPAKVVTVTKLLRKTEHPEVCLVSMNNPRW